MAKWRVWLDTETKSYLDVEAETKDEAWEIAEETDLDKFTEDTTYSHSELEEPYRLYDNTKIKYKVGDRVKVISDPILKKELWEAAGTVREVTEDGVLIDFDKKRLTKYAYNCLSFNMITLDED